MVNGWKLASVQRSTIADVVVRELRRAIVEGDIAQGEQLREEHLARMLGTGRGVIREALRQLAQEGLVEAMPHRGSFVRLLSLEDRLDVYAAREAIESGAALRALQSPEPLDLGPMRAALARLDAAAGGRRPRHRGGDRRRRRLPSRAGRAGRQPAAVARARDARRRDANAAAPPPGVSEL